MCNLRLSLIRDVIEPNRGTELSGGIDFYVPKFTEEFMTDFKRLNEDALSENLMYIDYGQNQIILAPNAHIMIPSGVVVNLIDIHEYMINTKMTVRFDAENRSSVARKLQLTVAAKMVDADYQGETHLSVINSSTKLVRIKPNMKLVQFAITPVIVPRKIEIVRIENLFKSDTVRGKQGFGHTDNAIDQTSDFLLRHTMYLSK